MAAVPNDGLRVQMQKKFISIILSVSIILLSVVPCFATENSTHAALRISDLKAVSDIRATSPATTVEPEDSSATRYYVNSNGNVTSSSTSINTWGNIVNDLTYSIAYSIGEVVKRLTTINNNVVNYLFSNYSTGYYLWDWTPSNGVYQGAPTSSQSVISQLRAMGSSLTKMLSYSTEYNYQNYQSLNNIEEVLTTDGGIKIELDHWSDLFYPDNTHWDRPTADQWNYFYTNYVGYNGALTTETFRSSNIFYQLKRYFVNNNNSLGTIGMFLGADTLYNSSADYPLTNNDLTTTTTPKKSIWWDIRAIGSNLSDPLHRLAFVLASDEEIEARQAASDNQESVIDNFIKPTGNGSASASDFADVASVGNSIKDTLDSNVSAGNAFTSLDSDSDAWNWFSQSTLNSLDSSTNQNRKSANSDTPLLDSYYSDLMETLRLK